MQHRPTCRASLLISLVIVSACSVALEPTGPGADLDGGLSRDGASLPMDDGDGDGDGDGNNEPSRPGDAGAGNPDGTDGMDGADSSVGEPGCPVRDDGRPSWHGLHGGEMLGARVLAPNQVEFSLFAPNAGQVFVTGSFNGYSPTSTPLSKQADGVWSAVVEMDDPAGAAYRFLVDGRSIADPYSRANEGNTGNSIVVGESDFAWTDGAFVRPGRDELVVYEVHVADFTRDPSSGVSEERRGKFEGFEDKISHLSRLGVNAVELMPVMESQPDGYDWGYSASLFFAPESSYASARSGSQVNELKALVNALHRAGIAVIVDVVFNHVWGQTGQNHFWGVDPVYYFDFDQNGDPENDRADWGYIMATHRPAMRKLMYDNLAYLMREFHVDGFRIDGTKHMDIEAVLEVLDELDDDGFCDRTFIAEEFEGAHNQRIRETNRALGRTLLSTWGTGYKNRVWDAIRYPSSSMTDLTQVTYFSANDGFRSADEVVNYVSSHDEGTLAAWLSASKEQVAISATHLLTAAGIPMLWSGDEFMRPHLGNHGPNPVRAENNVFDWRLVDSHADLVDYFGALIRLRTAHPSLHATLSGPNDPRFTWHNAVRERAIGYARTSPDDVAFVVLVNYQDFEQGYDVTFPHAGTYHLMADGRTARATLPGLSTLEVASEPVQVRVPARSARVYMSDR